MELPSITASSYGSSLLDAKLLGGGMDRRISDGDAQKLIHALGQQAKPAAPINQLAKEITVSTARIVKVFIADPNENLPLDKRVLYSGEEKLTDLTDQEMFYEVPINEILAKHNEVRKVTVDKKQAEKFGRDIFLEPARIRDLKMVVVTVAQF